MHFKCEMEVMIWNTPLIAKKLIVDWEKG